MGDKSKIETKRPERMRQFMPDVWLGVTVENQAMADERIPILLATPAANRFISIEPMLGPIDFSQIPRPEQFHRQPYGWHNYWPKKLHWVIVGGESGPNARPMHPDWARSIRDQCQAASVPFFFKQWGEWCPRGQDAPLDDWGNDEKYPARMFAGTATHPAKLMLRVGKKKAGRLLDGVEHSAFPAT